MFLWALFSVSVGWKHGGGVIPLLILMAIIASIWKTMTSTPQGRSDPQCSPVNSSDPSTVTPSISPPSSSFPSDDKKYYAQALKECTDGSAERDLGLWAKAFSESNGDNGRAQAKYIQQRVIDLMERDTKQAELKARISPVGVCPDCGAWHPVNDLKCPTCGRPKWKSI